MKSSPDGECHQVKLTIAQSLITAVSQVAEAYRVAFADIRCGSSCE